MPKQTFFNLNENKKNKIYKTLVFYFEKNQLKNATVKEIIDLLNLPRGSFYQYFESINDAYFYILENELSDIHISFIKLLKKSDMNLVKALDSFGEIISREIFDKNNYALYKNRYLSLDLDLESKWVLYWSKNNNLDEKTISLYKNEKMEFIRSIIHSLIQRSFKESWDKRVFIEKYNQYIKWIKGGIEL